MPACSLLPTMVVRMSESCVDPATRNNVALYMILYFDQMKMLPLYINILILWWCLYIVSDYIKKTSLISKDAFILTCSLPIGWLVLSEMIPCLGSPVWLAPVWAVGCVTLQVWLQFSTHFHEDCPWEPNVAVEPVLLYTLLNWQYLQTAPVLPWF